MKKIITILLTLAVTGMSCVFAAEYTKFSRKFIKHIKDCDAYEETVNSVFEDKQFTTHRKIHGWRNGLCQYTEEISSKDGAYRLDCRFAEIHIDDLYEAMRSRSKEPEKYNLEVFEPKVDPKTGETSYIVKGTTLIKGNRAYITWAKYQNNPYMCKATKIR